MFEITSMETNVPDIKEPEEEITQAIEEYAIGESLRERGLFRLWRIWKNKIYQMIQSDDPDVSPGQPKYQTWNQFIEEVVQPAGISRATVYSRIRAYSELEWLGYSAEEMIRIMSSRPGLYDSVLNKILEWDLKKGCPKELKTDSLGQFDDIDDAKDSIRELLTDLNEHESVSSAIGYVENDLLGQPEVRMRFVNGALVVWYESSSLDASTRFVDDFGRIEFLPTKDLPEWVIDEIEKKYKVKRMEE